MDELPLAIALRAGRPGHAQLRIRSARGEGHDIAVSAFPIVAKGATRGALAIFWAIEGDNRPR